MATHAPELSYLQAWYTYQEGKSSSQVMRGFPIDGFEDPHIDAALARHGIDQWTQRLFDLRREAAAVYEEDFGRDSQAVQNYFMLHHVTTAFKFCPNPCAGIKDIVWLSYAIGDPKKTKKRFGVEIPVVVAKEMLELQIERTKMLELELKESKNETTLQGIPRKMVEEMQLAMAANKLMFERATQMKVADGLDQKVMARFLTKSATAGLVIGAVAAEKEEMTLPLIQYAAGVTTSSLGIRLNNNN